MPNEEKTTQPEEKTDKTTAPVKSDKILGMTKKQALATGLVIVAIAVFYYTNKQK